MEGYVNGAVGGWTLHMGGAWVAFEVDLPAGDYLVEVQLATRLWSNNLNDSMGVEINLSARDNVEQTRSAQLVNAQMLSLYKRATNRALPPDLVDHMVSLLVQHAAEQENRSWRDNTHCEWWQMWSDWEDVSAAVVHERFHDPRGLIRGWTMVTHSILSSYTYLHD